MISHKTGISFCIIQYSSIFIKSPSMPVMFIYSPFETVGRASDKNNSNFNRTDFTLLSILESFL